MTNDEFKTQLPSLTQNYQPGAEALAQIKNISLLIVIGPSGVGKTTIINNLEIPYVPSDTTRAPRTDEVDGVDMNFLQDYPQVIADLKSGKFVQIAVGAAGDLYSTRASSYPQSGWAVMPVMADVVPIFRQLGFKQTQSVFIAPPSFDEWMHRMGSHQVEPTTLAKRMAEAERSFKFALNDPQTHFIMNDQVSDAVFQIKALLSGKLNQARELSARQAAAQCLTELQASL